MIALEAHGKHLLVIWNSLPTEPSKENDAANCHVASSSNSQKHPWLGPEGALQGIREEKEGLVCLGSPFLDPLSCGLCPIGEEEGGNRTQS